MKINNKKIIVSTLALAMGAALAGSISGSVAWYQYSTRAAAQITGTSAGTTGDLQVKLGSSGTYGHLATASGGKFQPISAKRDTSTGAVTYYDHPVYQAPNIPALTSDQLANAETLNLYHDYELYFKFSQSDGSTTSYLAKNVYLTYLEVVAADGAEKDVSAAVRVEILGTNKFLFSKNAAGQTVDTTGTLDIGGATGTDTTYWDCQDDPDEVTAGHATNVTYINGAAGSTSASYATQAHSAALVTVTDPYDLDTGNDAKILTTTKNTNADSVAVKVRVWIEGWALLGTTPSASWATELINQNFNVNMQFACSADRYSA